VLTVNIQYAKTNLSKLVERASKGESFVIARAGKPLVKASPLDAPKAREIRRIGFMAGQVMTPADFNTLRRTRA
jgi:antitoxin (DNA-binding transcriptional repressor) of toxin-antitoxin stability system